MRTRRVETRGSDSDSEMDWWIQIGIEGGIQESTNSPMWLGSLRWFRNS